MQKAPKILNYKNVALEKYEYLRPHKAQAGNYQSICNYRLSRNELLPFYFETPKLKTTSGIVRLDNKFYIDLELPQSGETSSFYQFLLKNDEQNITICHENSKEWFSNTMPLNIVESYYKTPILLKPNGQMPILRLHLPSYKGNILTELYNIRKEKINDILAIQEGDYIVGIVEFIGLSFLSQKFSPIYELQKIKIFKDNDYRNIPSGYIFSDINDKIDLDTIPKTSNDKILEQPIDIPINIPLNIVANTILEAPKKITLDDIEIKEQSNQSIDKPVSIPTPTPTPKPKQESITNASIIGVSTNNNNININNSDSKITSLFEMIKNTTLKDIINDNDIFLQNTKFLNEAKQKREHILEQIHKKQINKPILNTKNSINLPIDVDIKPIPIPLPQVQQVITSSPPTSPISIQDVNELNLDINYDLDIGQNETTNDTTNDTTHEDNDDMDDNMDDMNDNISGVEPDNDADNVSDDGINYDILNDLEVVVFDE